MRRIIITGITGFIGRHLYEVLKEKGVEIVAISRKIDLSMESVKWIEADLSCDLDEIKKGLNKYIGTIDVFYHLAWMGVKSKYKNTFDIQTKNITIANNVVEICKYVKCDRFINLGTVAEYVCEDGLINDKCLPSPMDLYGVMKVASRNIISTLCMYNTIEFINTIVCSTFGEYRSDDNIISYTIKSLLRNESPQYGLLNQMWDFLYVKDVANALFLIGSKGVNGKTYGIGSGRYRRLDEYIYEIRNIINPTIDLGVGILTSKYQRVLNSCVDSYQTQKDTGFYPEYSFKEGIIRTIEYYKGI